MEKSLKVFKYQLKGSIKPTIIFYGIFISVIASLVISREYLGGEVTLSGIELSTAIFLLVCALNSFKTQFYFAQGNNISRKSFFKGTILYGVVVSAILPIIDIIINRVCNLAIPCPMNYDMMYGTVRNIQSLDEMVGFAVNNSVETLIGTYLFTVVAYIFIIMLGLFITMLMFRLNKTGKFILAGIVAVLFLYTNLVSLIPPSFWVFLSDAFGLSTGNVYMGIMSLSILSIVAIAGQYLLIRRAEANKI
ncbi:MAG: hypothetical protein RR620_02875 [Clostridium sp.]